MIHLEEKTTMIFNALSHAGGTPYLVGGSVRDELIGMQTNDVDIECYGIGGLDIAKALRSVSEDVDAVGKAFSVFRVSMGDGKDYHISLPRREKKTGKGHTAFAVQADPLMTTEEACSRRDFTINAMMYSPERGIIDHFGGQKDLKEGILRHIDAESFSEDPLRVLRGMRLASKMGFSMDPETATLCEGLSDEYPFLSIERIWGEWAKWATSLYPMAGIGVLLETKWINFYPEIVSLSQQEKIDTFHMIGRMANIAEELWIPPADRHYLMFSALCARMGESGVMTFLNRIGAPQSVSKLVLPLVREFQPIVDGRGFKDMTPYEARRLARRIVPNDVISLITLVEANSRLTDSSRDANDDHDIKGLFLAASDCLMKPVPALITGNDLIGLNFSPSPRFREILALLLDEQDMGTFTTHEEGMQFVRALARTAIDIVMEQLKSPSFLTERPEARS